MYNPGYWKASPAAFKRDAEVYWQLLQASPKPQTPNPKPKPQTAHNSLVAADAWRVLLQVTGWEEQLITATVHFVR